MAEQLHFWDDRDDEPVPDVEPPNSRALTNIGTFRVYLEKYLESHPAISGEMLVLVRQLAPSPQGLPIEIYAFLKQQEWVEYERIQSSIFDHIISVLPVFGLRALQLSDDLRG